MPQMPTKANMVLVMTLILLQTAACFLAVTQSLISSSFQLPVPGRRNFGTMPKLLQQTIPKSIFPKLDKVHQHTVISLTAQVYPSDPSPNVSGLVEALMSQREKKQKQTFIGFQQIQKAEAKIRMLSESSARRLDTLLTLGAQGEHDPGVLDSSTDLPDDLPGGAFLRAGPNPAEGNKVEDFWEGDGMVHCLVVPPREARVKGQGGIYSRSWVRSAGFRKEAAEDEAVFANVFGSAPRGWPMLSAFLQNLVRTGQPVKDCCNTALRHVNGRVLACMEQTKPSELVVTRTGHIETLRPRSDLNGAIPFDAATGGSISAHWKQDPDTQERMCFTYNIFPAFARHDVFSGDGKLTSSTTIPLPRATMIHDLAITPRYSVLLDLPLTFRLERMLLDQFPLQYEPCGDARIGLLPRHGTSQDIRWFEVQPGVVLHTINAFERRDNTVIVHALRSTPKGPSSFPRRFAAPFPYQWVLDLQSGNCIHEGYLSDSASEFPTMHPQFVGREARHAYAIGLAYLGAGTDNGTEFGLCDKLLKYDLQLGGVSAQYKLPDGHYITSEPVCVPKIASSPDTGNTDAMAEDECYLFLYTTHVTESGRNQGSSLLLFDAAGDGISQGPVCSMELPEGLPMGLHCEFVPWGSLS